MNVNYCQGWAAEVEKRQAEAEVLHHHYSHLSPLIQTLIMIKKLDPSQARQNYPLLTLVDRLISNIFLSLPRRY